MKIIPLTYSFDKTAKTVTCADFTDIEKIAIITNLTAGDVIYQFNNSAKCGTLVGSVLTLVYDTSAMNNSDKLQIIIHDEAPKTENGALAIGNGINKFRDGFTEGFNTDIWDESWTNQGTGFRTINGNSSGASYLLASMCPFTPDMEYTLTSKAIFKMPIRFGYGMTMSQRLIGDEVEVSLVGCDANGVVESNTPIAPLTISGTVSITSNVATINFATPHGLTGAVRVVIIGNTENRLNVGPVYPTIVTKTRITVPCTLANGTYTAGGQVVWADTFGYVQNAVGFIYQNPTATSGEWSTRRNGGSAISVAATVSTTVAVIGSASTYTEAFRSAGDMEIISTMEHAKYFARAGNAQTAVTGNGKWTESIPDEEKYYKIRLRVKNLPSASRAIARITSINKVASTTATVTTDVPHGLVTGQFVQIYGVRDITNFPNLVAQTAVTVTGANTFTIIIGSSSTTTSAGGIVYVNNGSNLATDLYNFSIQSIARTSNVLTVTLNTTAAGTVGEWVHLYGMDGSGAAYEGAYKTVRVTGSTVEFESVGADFGSITCGGAMIKRTDVRIHYFRLLDYTRHLVELSNNRGSNDASESIPVTLSATGTVNAVQSSAAGISATTGFGGWMIHPALVGLPDIASAAITTTTTTASIANALGSAFQVTIPVTAVSGTTPTIDITIEESFDGGTNWVTLYQFQRITATGSYNTPILRATGRNIRYVQTLTGTTPSFTRAITRNILPFHNAEPQKRLFDRAINVNTLNTTTAALFSGASNNVQLVVNMGAITTTAPQFFLQGSEDNVNWYDIGTALTAVASSTVQLTIPDSSHTFVRARTSTAGSGATLGYISIKAYS